MASAGVLWAADEETLPLPDPPEEQGGGVRPFDPEIQQVLFGWNGGGISTDPLRFHQGLFYLELGTLTPDSGIALGGGLLGSRDYGWPLDLDASASYSVQGYELYRFQFGRIGARHSKLGSKPIDTVATSHFDSRAEKERGFSLFADLRYRHFPKYNFFGLGPDSTKGDRTAFLFQGASYDGVLEYQFNRWLGTGIRTGLLQPGVGPGRDRRFPPTRDVFTDEQAPGLLRQPDFLHFNWSVLVDYRDQPGNPKRGGIVGFMFARLDERGGSEFEFNRFIVDARHFLPLGDTRRVLAVRFFTSADSPATGSRVPFYLQESLGGGDTLRGFETYRFRDRALLYLSAEYRLDAFPFVELGFFYDAGKAFSGASHFNFRDLKHSAGAGVRFKTPKSLVFRMDLAGSTEGVKVHFRLGAAF